MIWESSYWKDDLKKQSAELKKRMVQKRWRDASLARCEQIIMIGFYSVRKLIESKNLTGTVSKSVHKIRCYKSTGKPITLFTRRNVDELYDLENSRLRTEQLTYLCHQVIHSYVFCSYLAGTICCLLFLLLLSEAALRN